MRSFHRSTKKCCIAIRRFIRNNSAKTHLPLLTTVDIFKHIDRYGVIYSIGNIVVVSKENFELQFGEIKFIVRENKRCVLLIRKLETIGFNSLVHAYQVKIPIAATSICLDFTELFDYYPLDLHNSISDGNAYVRLRVP